MKAYEAHKTQAQKGDSRHLQNRKLSFVCHVPFDGSDVDGVRSATKVVLQRELGQFFRRHPGHPLLHVFEDQDRGRVAFNDQIQLKTQKIGTL